MFGIRIPGIWGGFSSKPKEGKRGRRSDG